MSQATRFSERRGDLAPDPTQALANFDANAGSMTGNNFWVSSNSSGLHQGSDVNPGTRDKPRATIDSAIGLCTANQGDTIHVFPGHTEVITAAGGITCDVAGIKILGHGWGNMRPKVTFTTATTATFLISADNVWVENIWFECDKTGADLVTMIDINTAAYVTIENCVFTEGASDEQALRSIILQDATDDFCTIRNCRFISETAAAAAAIDIQAAVNEFAMYGCDIQGDYSVACLMSTSLAHLNNHIIGNFFRNDGASDHAIEFTGAATGIIANNLGGTAVSATTSGATVIDGGSCKMAQNFMADADADKSGLLVPEGT